MPPSVGLPRPGGGTDFGGASLAAPALEFARHVPALAGALDLSVREAVAARVMLVPGVADPRASRAIGLGRRHHGAEARRPADGRHGRW
jgi:hypothetical protein